VTDELLSLLDVLVDGRFIQAQKDISLRFRGSRNQRLIDLNATRQAGRLCFLPDRQRGC
jgi:anaerobic ribonucleoside-triphosphate reductase activating protein